MSEMDLDEKYPLRPTYFDAPLPIQTESAYPVDAYGNYIDNYQQYQYQNQMSVPYEQYQVK